MAGFRYLALPLILLTLRAQAYEYAHESSVGIAALRAPSAAVISRADMSWVNGLIVSSPKDTKRYDQRAITSIGLGFNAAFSPIVVKVQTRGFATRKSEFDLSTPKQTITSVKFSSLSNLDVAYQMSSNELIAGAIIKSQSQAKVNSTSSTYESTTSEPSATVYSPRFAFVHRTGDWTTGVSYTVGAQKKRTLTTEVSDGSSLQSEDVVSVTSEIGLFAGSQQGNIKYEIEVNLIQGSSSGIKNSAGSAAEKDYFRLYGSGLWRPDSTGIRASLIYKTLSYSDQAYMTLDNISQITAEVLGEFGAANAYVFFGGAYTQGTDSQSVTELNAKYTLQAYSFKTGFVTLF